MKLLQQKRNKSDFEDGEILDTEQGMREIILDLVQRVIDLENK